MRGALGGRHQACPLKTPDVGDRAGEVLDGLGKAVIAQMPVIRQAIIAAEDAGARLDRDTLVATAVFLMQAGHETTTDSIGNSVVALLRQVRSALDPDHATARVRIAPETLERLLKSFLEDVR